MSELQLVKFYSGRKLVTSLSNYSGLESAQPVRVQARVGIWPGRCHTFSSCQTGDMEVCRGVDLSGGSRCIQAEIRIRL